MIEIIIALIVLAFIMECIDAGFGMGYGTILSPLLLAFGFAPTVIVPALLISQASGGLTAAVFHHKAGNADFSRGKQDLKVVGIITALGVLATIFSVVVALSIPAVWMKAYIGVLVSVMGLILVSGYVFKFSWKKIAGIGIISAFNKGLSGGGFGPVVTGGQLVVGKEEKSSIGCTTLAEAPICLTGFVAYWLMNGFSEFWIAIPLCVGAVLAAPFGATIAKRTVGNNKRWLGVLILILGAYTLFKLI